MGFRERAQERQTAAKLAKEERRAEEAVVSERTTAFIATLPHFEYQVKRVGDDKQKGLLGSQRMEQLFNAEGKNGWELVTINAERATFKRQLPPG